MRDIKSMLTPRDSSPPKSPEDSDNPTPQVSNPHMTDQVLKSSKTYSNHNSKIQKTQKKKIQTGGQSHDIRKFFQHNSGPKSGNL